MRTRIFTEKEELCIAEAYCNGVSAKALSILFDVDRKTIYNIYNRQKDNVSPECKLYKEIFRKAING